MSIPDDPYTCMIASLGVWEGHVNMMEYHSHDDLYDKDQDILEM